MENLRMTTEGKEESFICLYHLSPHTAIAEHHEETPQLENVPPQGKSDMTLSPCLSSTTLRSHVSFTPPRHQQSWGVQRRLGARKKSNVYQPQSHSRSDCGFPGTCSADKLSCFHNWRSQSQCGHHRPLVDFTGFHPKGTSAKRVHTTSCSHCHCLSWYLVIGPGGTAEDSNYSCSLCGPPPTPPTVLTVLSPHCHGAKQPDPHTQEPVPPCAPALGDLHD